MVAVLAVLLTLASASPAGISEAQGEAPAGPERIEVAAADYEGAWVKLTNHLLKLFLPEGWEMASGEDGALLIARDPEKGHSLRVEELILPGVTLEGVMEAFRADKEMQGVTEVYINDLRLVRYESPANDVLGFVSLTGYSDRVLLFKFEPASDKEFAGLAVRVMSTLTRMAKGKARVTPTPVPEVTPKPTATPIAGLKTWAELLKAAKAGKSLVYIGADIKRGASQKTAVFNNAVTIRSADGKQYVIDGNGKQAIRVEKADGGRVTGTTEIVGLKFVGGDAGEAREDIPGSGQGGAVYVNGDLKVTDSAFENNKAAHGGAIAASGNIVLSGTAIQGNTASGNGGGVYAGEIVVISGGSQVIHNSALAGGGVFSDTGGVQVLDGEVSGNLSFMGGGIYSSVGPVSVGSGKVSGNSAFMGGGIYTFRGDVSVSGGEISGNDATDGGGIYIYEGDAAVSGGKVADNTAMDYGGGIFVSTGSVTVTGGEVTNNSALNLDGGGVFIADGTAADKQGNVRDNFPNNIAPESSTVTLLSSLDAAPLGPAAFFASPGSVSRESAGSEGTGALSDVPEGMFVESASAGSFSALSTSPAGVNLEGTGIESESLVSKGAASTGFVSAGNEGLNSQSVNTDIPNPGSGSTGSVNQESPVPESAGAADTGSEAFNPDISSPGGISLEGTAPSDIFPGGTAP